MKKIFENAVWWSGVVMVGLILGISLQFVRAWTEPTTAPPGGNVGAPINTGSVEQNKTGWFTFQGGGTRYGTFLATVGGNVGIGTVSPGQKLDVVGKMKIGDDAVAPAAGTIRWNGTDFEGYDGTTWKSFTATGGESGGGFYMDGYCKMVATPWTASFWSCSSTPDHPAYCKSDDWCACSKGTLVLTASGANGPPSTSYIPSTGDWGEYTCKIPITSP